MTFVNARFQSFYQKATGLGIVLLYVSPEIVTSLIFKNYCLIIRLISLYSIYADAKGLQILLFFK